MNILITGCNGQLGNELQLLEAKYQQHTFFNTDVNELDITNQLAVDDYVFRNQIDCIINCAAYTAVDKAEEQKELCTTLNTVAPSYLAAAVEKRGGCMIQISTDYVFDGTHSTPYVETDTPAPNSVYGCTKLAGELGVTKFCKKSIVIRTAWLYSTFGNNFVKTMLRLGRERKELGVVADQIGSPTYAADLAAAIMTIVEKGVKPGVYHYTNEGVASWYDFTKAIHRMAGIKDCNVKPIHTSDYPTAATRPAYSVLDKKKITDDYQLTIPHWEEALQRCMDSLLNQ
ncbi:MAG: dTDP-4-dehydrorhamnose reductase [Prevotella sp.]|nr:dTDP-4-dehydrorhamnose reductase [Prevotella sp.]MDD6737866.1 dTDP-4-dehydrorhamnose reductase [Prevotella sp.]MDY6092242.1 dTDP-4-dehydrorhamnose reductase [Prevotella sp.]